MKFIILMVLFLGPLFSSGNEGGDGDYVRREKRARERAEYDRKIRRELQERVTRLENQRSDHLKKQAEYFRSAYSHMAKQVKIMASKLEACEIKSNSLKQDLDGTTRLLEKERGGAIGTTRQLGGLSGTFKKVGGGAIR